MIFNVCLWFNKKKSGRKTLGDIKINLNVAITTETKYSRGTTCLSGPNWSGLAGAAVGCGAGAGVGAAVGLGDTAGAAVDSEKAEQ